jgi:hypothetical protein
VEAPAGCKLVEVRYGAWAIVDNDDYDKANTLTWWLTNGYAHHSYKEHGQRITVYLGRYLTDCPEHLVVAYLNLDPLDCRRSNMIVCSKSQQLMNQLVRSGMFKGVAKSRSRWTARAWDESGKRVHLGVYASPEAAADAYDDFVRQRFGAFARYNFPRPGERPARLVDVVATKKTSSQK